MHANGLTAPVSLAPLNGLAGYLIRQAQLWVFQDFNETLAPLDVRPVQFSILTLISTFQLPELYQPLLDSLESRGLLKRAASITDRRSHALHLTTEGKALLVRANALVQEHEERLRQKVGPSGHKQLLKVLEVFGRS